MMAYEWGFQHNSCCLWKFWKMHSRKFLLTKCVHGNIETRYVMHNMGPQSFMFFVWKQNLDCMTKKKWRLVVSIFLFESSRTHFCLPALFWVPWFLQGSGLVILFILACKVQFPDPLFSPQTKPFCVQIKGSSGKNVSKSGKIVSSPTTTNHNTTSTLQLGWTWKWLCTPPHTTTQC